MKDCERYIYFMNTSINQGLDFLHKSTIGSHGQPEIELLFGGCSLGSEDFWCGIPGSEATKEHVCSEQIFILENIRILVQYVDVGICISGS